MSDRVEGYPTLRNHEIFEQLMQQNCISGIPTDGFNAVVRARFFDVEMTFQAMDENNIRYRRTVLKELSAIWKQSDPQIARKFEQSIRREHKEFPLIVKQ